PNDVELAFAAVRSGKRDELAALLANDRGLAAARSASGVSILLEARYHNQLDLVELLLSAAQPLDIFEASAIAGGEGQGAALLENDPGLARAFSADGFTALHLAAYFAQEAMARILLDRGANPDAVSRNAMHLRPLHSAAAGKAGGILAMLLDRGADASAK